MNYGNSNHEKKNEILGKIEDVFQKFKENVKDSKELLKDPDKVLKKLKEAYEKADNIKEGSFHDIIEDFFLMIDVVKAYVKKEYRAIPSGSIVAILAAIIYVVNPFDVVPDVIPGIGYIDDAFIVAMVLKQVHKDLQAYKEWRDGLEK